MKIVVTGSEGFIGRNLITHFREIKHVEILEFRRRDTINDLELLINQADCIVHLAGVNRVENPEEFKEVNTDLTNKICNFILNRNKKIPLLYASSKQAVENSPYGLSKLKAEKNLAEFSKISNCPVAIYRLPGVFGKWCKPNYNSVVATFCNNIAKDIPIDIHDPNTLLNLVYIDDVVAEIVDKINNPAEGCTMEEVKPEYKISVGDLAKKINEYRDMRADLGIMKVGEGFDRALYSTYMSYLQPKEFAYEIHSHNDERGRFAEVLKTQDSGQFSFFSALPGVTRGGHYHHTKTEKFLVIRGQALFKFKNLLTEEYFELLTDDKTLKVVDTIPGWTHNITNVGEEEMLVMLWANEVFDQKNPDTYASEVFK